MRVSSTTTKDKASAKERAKTTAEKINYAQHHAVGSADTAVHHAKSIRNLAEKSGASKYQLQEIDRAIEKVESAVKSAKGKVKDIKPDSSVYDVKDNFEEVFNVGDALGALRHAVKAVQG